MAVIVTGLIPLLAIAILSLSVSTKIKNSLVAANLAQEGIEVVRSLRDDNWYRGNPFNAGLIGTWRVQWNTNWSSNPPQAVGLNPPLNIDISDVYSYDLGTTTGFTRTLTITEPAPGIELKVISLVEWDSKYQTPGCSVGKSCIKVEAHLFNWK